MRLRRSNKPTNPARCLPLFRTTVHIVATCGAEAPSAGRPGDDVRRPLVARIVRGARVYPPTEAGRITGCVAGAAPPPVPWGLKQRAGSMVASCFWRPPWSKKPGGRKAFHRRRWRWNSRLSVEALEDRVVLSLNATLFELDGNTVDNPAVAGDDWDTLYAGSRARAHSWVIWRTCARG